MKNHSSITYMKSVIQYQKIKMKKLISLRHFREDLDKV